MDPLGLSCCVSHFLPKVAFDFTLFGPSGALLEAKSCNPGQGPSILPGVA